ncbi:hypothetical protein [Curtobacterium sp. RRHDQ10]|uniref:hypothetical protein n=1 Tax=Curtobacterium phyllosphaerae TaxID=3413379 RepID=UPI003BF3F5D5
MKPVFFVAVGVVIGALVASRVTATTGGRRFLVELDTRTKAFRSAILDGYRSREAELRARPDPDA